jgi:hypothetical protein
MRLSAQLVAILSLLPLFWAVQANACSEVACLNNGFETHRDFTVTVLHSDRPLAGVSVEINTNDGSVQTRRFFSMTDSQGKVHVTSLTPGQYWLKAELLGISAAYQCFHIGNTPSRRAKRKLKYE